MDRPDIVIQAEEHADTTPQIPPDSNQTQQAFQAQPQPVRVNISNLKEENRTFSIITLLISIISLILVGLAFFLKIDPLFLVGVGLAVLGIILSVYAQTKKKQGEKYAFAGLVISGLALLSAILIFVRTIVVPPS